MLIIGINSWRNTDFPQASRFPHPEPSISVDTETRWCVPLLLVWHSKEVLCKEKLALPLDSSGMR